MWGTAKNKSCGHVKVDGDDVNQAVDCISSLDDRVGLFKGGSSLQHSSISKAEDGWTKNSSADNSTGWGVLRKSGHDQEIISLQVLETGRGGSSGLADW